MCEYVYLHLKCISFFLLVTDVTFIFKKVSLPVRDILGQIKNKTLKECNKQCYKYPACNSYQYDEENKLCVLSNLTLPTDELKPSKKYVVVYITNPG